MKFYAQDIMTSNVITVRPDMLCEDVAEILIANRISGAPVVSDSDELIGVISFQDILLNSGQNFFYSSNYFEESRIDAVLEQEGLHLTTITDGFVSDYMTRHVFTVFPDTPVQELSSTMFDHRIHRVIVLDRKTMMPVGIVTTFDLLKILAQKISPSQGGELLETV